MWLLVTLIGYIALAVVNILDKFIISERKVPPLRFVFYSSIFTLPVLLLAPWVARPGALICWIAAALSGFSFALGLWTMYLGIKKGEISHVAPLVGGVTPVFILFFSRYFLHEVISAQQTWAILLLILGSLLIAFQNTEEKRDWKLALFWGVLAGILFAVSHTAAKYLYDQIGFSGGFVWSRGFIGVVGILLLFYPPFFRSIMRRRPTEPVPSRPLESKSHLLAVATDKILGVAGAILIQYAIALGSVTVVNALAGVQYAVLLILIGVFSGFFPRVFREQYSVPEIIQEVLAVVIIGLGLFLLF